MSRYNSRDSLGLQDYKESRLSQSDKAKENNSLSRLLYKKLTLCL